MAGQVFIPSDPEIVRFAETIEQEVTHVLNEQDEPGGTGGGGGVGPTGKGSIPLGADGEQVGVIHEGQDYDPLQMARAQKIAGLTGHPLQTIMEILRADDPAFRERPGSPPLADKLKKLRLECSDLANQLTGLRSKSGFGYDPKWPHREWLARDGTPQQQADEHDLEKKVRWLREEIAKLA
jgi:hypothetical protein